MVNTEIRLILFFAAKGGEGLYSQQEKKKKQNKTLGVNCGTDHELFTAKFRLKLKKVGKTTRSLKYDLNQIPYEYTVEVMSKIRGIIRSDRQECLKNYRWKFIPLCSRQWPKPKTIPKKKKCMKAKCLSEDALQIAEKRSKGKGERARYTHLNAEFQRIARRDKKAFLSEQCKEIEGKIEWQRLKISSRK